MSIGERRDVSVRAVTVEDNSEVSAVMARAFADDPLINWILPKESVRVPRMTKMMEVMVPRMLPLDNVEMYTTADRAGLAQWQGPESWDVPARAMLPVMPRVVGILGLGAMSRYSKTMGALKKVHPKEPHWYLAGIGTDPPKQGTGVGSALVRHMLERCDAEKVPAYLETQKPRNVPWYERFGFRVTGEIDLPGGGPHMWLMWRDPQ